MSSDPSTQCSQILRTLKKGKTLTPLEALREFGCFRLAARIHELKEQGIPIKSALETKRGKRVAVYWIEKAAA